MIFRILVLFFTSFSKACFSEENRRELLITGCFCSGTLFISDVFQLCGLDIQHEELVGKDGISSWIFTVDSDIGPFEWGQPRRGMSFNHIFHQVRHPLKAFPTLCAMKNKELWEFIIRYVPEIKPEDSKIVRGAKFWYYWNLLAEAQAELTYRIEDIDQYWNEIQQRPGRDLDKQYLKIADPKRNPKFNRLEAEVSWEYLKENLDIDLYNKVKTLAEHYGYM